MTADEVLAELATRRWALVAEAAGFRVEGPGRGLLGRGPTPAAALAAAVAAVEEGRQRREASHGVRLWGWLRTLPDGAGVVRAGERVTEEGDVEPLYRRVEGGAAAGPALPLGVLLRAKVARP